MAVWCVANFKKGRQHPLLSAAGCHTRPDHSAELLAEGRALKRVMHFEAWFPGPY